MFNEYRQPFFFFRQSPALVVFSIQRCSMNVNERTLPVTLAVTVRAGGSGSLRVNPGCGEAFGRWAKGARDFLAEDGFQ